MIEVSHLSFTYKSYAGRVNKPVFQDINLSVKQGERILILGAPDSGKSTMARILCNLVPRYIEGTLTGTIHMNDKPIQDLAPWELTNICTLVAQNPQEQLLMTTCADEVAFPLESLGVRREDLVSSVHSSLHKWGLSEMIEVNPQELSGGERKRLLVAVAEAINAPVWIMDEPFDDLDESWRTQLLQTIMHHEGTVVVFASRYLEEFRGSFSSYYLIDQGTLVKGSEEDIVIAFDKACDFQFAAHDAEILIPEKHRLQAQDLVIVHPRRSVSSTAPFTLKVPNISIESGEVVALVGPNGSGKSTLSRVLCGLDPVSQGDILYNEKPMSDKALRSRIGYLFQNPDFGIFLPTVKDELGWSLRHTSQLTTFEQEELIASSAALFHLHGEDNPTTMSYGARKHLQAAVYYVLNRPFYILDELDSGVTYAAAFEIVSLLRQRGAGIILITHDRAFANHIAERQYSIVDGVVYEREVGA